MDHLDYANLLTRLTGGDEAQAEAAICVITSLPIEAARRLLTYLEADLDSPDPDRRWWAVRALPALQGVDATSQLIQALSDEDPAVRQCAALGLRTRPAAAAVMPLMAALADPDGLVSRLAGDALVEIGSEAVPGLIQALAGGLPSVQIAAARALAAIGDHRSIPALFAALDSDSAFIEYWAGEGLEHMGVGMSFFNPG